MDQWLPGAGGGGRRKAGKKYEASFWGDKNVLELESGDSCITLPYKYS